MRIFLAENSQKTGPFDPWEVRGRLERGEITPEMLGWHEGCETWVRLKDLPALGMLDRPDDHMPPPLPLPDEATGKSRELNPASGSQADLLYPDGELPRPWSRFLARFMDMLIWLTLCVAFLRLAGQPIVAFLLSPLQMLLAHALMVVPEAICLSVFGTTPGKALLGLRVQAKGGDGLPAAALAWKRSLLVFAIGNAFYYSFVAVAAWVYHYIGLMRDSSTWWDRQLGLQVRGAPIRSIQIVRFVLFFTALNIIFSAVIGQENMEEWLRLMRMGPEPR